jgi:putative two-component system response regulator
LIAEGSAGSAALSRVLADEGFAVTHVDDGRAALDRMRQGFMDVAILDRDLPGIGGTEVCRLARRDQSTRLLPVLLLLPDGGSSEERLEGIGAGADQIVSMPIDVSELVARICRLVRQKRYTDDFELAASVMTTLSSIIEARERYSEGHCHRMANHCAVLGRRIGLSGEEIHVLRRGAFLHDIGMVAVSDAVLLKPARLNAKERALVESHTLIGETIISNLRSLQPVRGIVRHHHERRDGSGYPDGLRGDDIPQSAQIVGIVDVFEAMTSPRPYRKSVSPNDALAMLRRQTEKGYHRPDLFQEFANIIAA